MSIKNNLILRWMLGGMIPFLLIGSISYIAPGSNDIDKLVSKGDYILRTELQGKTIKYQGPVYFEFDRQQSGLRNTRVFKLHFLSSEISRGYSFGFLIPITGKDMVLQPEEFWVNEEKKNILSRDDSVFGYADLFDTNSSLYFTESGMISIKSIAEDAVSGNLNMFLKDVDGKELHLAGFFNALPLKTQRNF
ncbi:hypothetical protein [Robiginitalea sp. IMCC43444]|uniref:hypothetical protein n=1 Tax=Robiginitalea sp. IMCC43444 TaxID=3459121 RepID=UPI0040416C5D